MVELTRLSSACSVPSTLRSPSSPIHEEDDSEALPALGGAGLALSTEEAAFGSVHSGIEGSGKVAVTDGCCCLLVCNHWV